MWGEGLVWGWGGRSVRWGVDVVDDDDNDDDGDDEDEDGGWCWWRRTSCPERRLGWFGKLACEWVAEGGGLKEEEEEEEEAAMLVLLFKAAMLERTWGSMGRCRAAVSAGARPLGWEDSERGGGGGGLVWGEPWMFLR